jgi:hypothetical protein
MGDKVGPIVFFPGTVNQDVYIEVLRQYLDPFIEALAADGITNIEFEQDNAPPHTGNRAREFLDALAKKHGFTIMPWPANSPDLSPIENLWAYLKDELRKQYPDTPKLSGSPQTIRAVLRQRLHKIWWEIREDVLNALVEDMPERCKKVIAAKGWYMED